jgi:metal-responsive CopG/Arc/MetJ family transcriptional regulator
MAKRSVTVSMAEDLYAAAEDARWGERMSMSAFVERAVREHLERRGLLDAEG